ncbi:MAG: hypothetical protein ACYC6Y_03060 [Thermoguttaceae bacterium]
MSADNRQDESPPPLVQNSRLLEFRSGSVSVYCSPESEDLGQRIAQYADSCNHYLAGIFGDSRPPRQNVYWLAKADWLNPPQTYGFPYNVGPNAVLAAADAELPSQLALIADFMSLESGGDQVIQIARMLGLEGSDGGQPPTGSGPPGHGRVGPKDHTLAARVFEALTRSRRFFVDYSLGFILPHEMTHGYCQVRDLPETPRWYYEGVAQWAAFHMQRQFQSPNQAETVYAYYQLLWDRADDRLAVSDFREADRLGHLGLDTPSYAWYHAGLLRMFRQLERDKGADLLPDLVRSVRQELTGQGDIPRNAMIAIFSRVVGRDLNAWFSDEWGL